MRSFRTWRRGAAIESRLFFAQHRLDLGVEGGADDVWGADPEHLEAADDESVITDASIVQYWLHWEERVRVRIGVS